MNKTPWWFGALLILVAVISFGFSWAAAHVLADANILSSASSGWLYPAYIVVSTICSWVCYPSRRALAWILLAMMLLLDIGLWISIAKF